MKKRLVISDELTLAYVEYGAGKPVHFHTGLDLHHESLREKTCRSSPSVTGSWPMTPAVTVNQV